jgi:uncharacterized protein YigE (DUF2233 family)
MNDGSTDKKTYLKRMLNVSIINRLFFDGLISHAWKKTGKKNTQSYKKGRYAGLSYSQKKINVHILKYW